MAFTVQAFYNAINLVRDLIPSRISSFADDHLADRFSNGSAWPISISSLLVGPQYTACLILPVRINQVILTASLEDPSFGIPGIKYLNVIMQYGYLGIVIACFLFSMGNRPQG